MLPSPGNRGQTPSSHFVAVLFAGALAAQPPFDWQQVRGFEPLTQHAMVYDSARSRVVLFGGTGLFVKGSTWEWDGATWTVLLVHHEHEIEAVEVLGDEHALAEAREVVAASAGVADGARVRRRPWVVVVGCCRVDVDAALQPLLPDQFQEHALRGGGATDVAGADEEHRDFTTSWHTVAF